MNETLFENYNKALRVGVESLSKKEVELFLIQDFILEYEQNVLSGFLYNRLPDLKIIEDTILAMRKYKMNQVADYMDQVLLLFENYIDPDIQTTWGHVLKSYDPDDKFDVISSQISRIYDDSNYEFGFKLS